MKSRLFVIAVIASVIAVMSSTHGAQPLPRSTPEAEGISSQVIADFVEVADKKVNTFESFKVIAEGWWKPSSAGKPHILNSVSKSFNSTAIERHPET